MIKIILPLFSCGSDFEFSLGSFSLLEEITSGQEWAKFLTPKSASFVQCHPVSKAPLALPFSDVNAIQTWPGDVQPVSMDVSEGEQSGHRATEQMESVEDGHAASDMTIGRQRRPLSLSQVARQFLPFHSFHSLVNVSLLIRFHMQPADVQSNSSMKSRVQMNRKRHHHLTERTEKDLQMDVQHPDKGQGHLSRHKWSSGLYGQIM